MMMKTTMMMIVMMTIATLTISTRIALGLFVDAPLHDIINCNM